MSTITMTPSITGPTLLSPQVRLTRRGRLVVLVAAMLVVLGAALFLANASMASNEAGAAPQETEVVMVGYGETLWGIASDLAPDGEVREMVATIRDLNALESSMLMAGQELHVPVVD